jgi:hypothetical protein
VAGRHQRSVSPCCTGIVSVAAATSSCCMRGRSPVVIVWSEPPSKVKRTARWLSPPGSLRELRRADRA